MTMGMSRVAFFIRCAAGVVVTERMAHWVGENQHNAAYLAVKRRKMGHHPDQPVRLRALSSARKS